MNFDKATEFIQQHFTDGLVLIIGSGLSVAEGLPGMVELANHLMASSIELSGADAHVWKSIAHVLATNEGLEAALLKHPPTASLENWVARKTTELISPVERSVICSVVKGDRSLRLTAFLKKILKPANGLPILTPNYDRLIETACEMAGLHVDTTAVGEFVGRFDPQQSCMASCRRVNSRGKLVELEHFPRAVVLKPHGSLDWYKSGGQAIRSTMDLDCDRLIITPGLNKYRAGYEFPFDKHREMANAHICQAAKLLIVGYGFNDDHLQTHLIPTIKGGTATLIMTRTASNTVKALAANSPRCFCLCKPDAKDGTNVLGKDINLEIPDVNLWDIGELTKTLLL